MISLLLLLVSPGQMKTVHNDDYGVGMEISLLFWRQAVVCARVSDMCSSLPYRRCGKYASIGFMTLQLSIAVLTIVNEF